MERYAKVAYEAYRAHTGGKSLVSGQPLPTWADLPEKIREAWVVAVDAACDELAEDI